MTGAREILRSQALGLAAAWRAAGVFAPDMTRHRRSMIAALALSAAATAARIAEPWPLKVIIDHALLGRPLATGIAAVDAAMGRPLIIVAGATAAMVGLALVRGACAARQSIITARIGQTVISDVRRRAFAHLQRLPLSFHARSRTGDLLTRLLTDVALLRDLLVGSLLSLSSEVVVLVGFLIVMVAMDWRLAAWSVLAVPVVLGLLLVYGGRIRRATRDQRRREGQLASRVQEVLSGIHVVQLFAREEREDERIGRLSEGSARAGVQASELEARLEMRVETALAVATALTLGSGALRVIGGHLTPGELVVFASYMTSFYKPMRRIAAIAERAGKAASSVERIHQILVETSDLVDGVVPAPRFRGDIELRGVSYAYRTGSPVLEDVDLHVEAGRTVALVGPSGAGKSTLLGLVPRLYDPTSGQVLIDGTDVREYTLATLRSRIAFVPQDGALFAGTARENIAFGRPEADDGNVEAAARAAQIHRFLASLPEGYDTHVGERGVTLSGGQRQRLAIARAILVDAPIVLLDEPTTGLDTEAERLVMRAMAELLSGRTALVIAHRLATIRDADRIAVVEGGRIVESGDHGSLLARQGRYRRLALLAGDESTREATR